MPVMDRSISIFQVNNWENPKLFVIRKLNVDILFRQCINILIMRPHIQHQIITLNLKVSEHFRQRLVDLEVSLADLLEKGQRWLDDDDDVMTFVQMNQFLVNENSRCLQTYLDMANGKEEVCLCDEDASLGKKTSKLIPTSNDKEERSEPQRNKEEINGDRSIPPSSIQTETNFSTLNDKIETVTKSLTKKIKSLQKRNTDQENFIQEMLKNQTIAENKTKAKLDDFLTELHKANEYIKFQTEFLSQKVENCKDSNETIRNQQEQIENNYKENIENITKQLQSCHELIKVETESLDKLRKELQATKDCNDLIKSENHIFLTKLSHVENTLHDVSKDLEKLKKDFTDISISVSQTESSNKLNLEHFRNTFTDIDDRMISFSSDLDKMTGDIVTISKPLFLLYRIFLFRLVWCRTKLFKHNLFLKNAKLLIGILFELYSLSLKIRRF
ncbi:CAP-Gly domain-containing linker protein 1 [Biomphalaria glabrata]|nr:CAP-Gly domain-containing linker protein 1 [Biomphalaria glabrata]